MQVAEEKTYTNLNRIRLKGTFTKKIHSGKIIDVWEFRTDLGEFIGVNARKSYGIEIGETYEVLLRLCLYYSVGREGKTFNQNFARLASMYKPKNESEEMDK